MLFYLGFSTLSFFTEIEESLPRINDEDNLIIYHGCCTTIDWTVVLFCSKSKLNIVMFAFRRFISNALLGM